MLAEWFGCVVAIAGDYRAGSYSRLGLEGLCLLSFENSPLYGGSLLALLLTMETSDWAS